MDEIQGDLVQSDAAQPPCVGRQRTCTRTTQGVQRSQASIVSTGEAVTSCCGSCVSVPPHSTSRRPRPWLLADPPSCLGAAPPAAWLGLVGELAYLRHLLGEAHRGSDSEECVSSSQADDGCSCFNLSASTPTHHSSACHHLNSSANDASSPQSRRSWSRVLTGRPLDAGPDSADTEPALCCRVEHCS